MSWHLTWQDPVAIALVVAGVWFAMRLRRARPEDGCAQCKQAKATERP